MTPNSKLRLLHLWNSEEEAERLVRQLAESGFEFEATLVKSETEYASMLVRREFDLIIVDESADFHASGSEHLSALEIAREIAPTVPFILVGERRCEADEAGSIEGGFFRVPRQRLNLIESLVRELRSKASIAR